MHPIFRILRKDLYHYRWAILLIVGLFGAILLTFNLCFGFPAHPHFQGLIQDDLEDYFIFITGILRIIVVPILLAKCISDDPLTETETWWTTRPISRAQVLTAKILFGLLLMLVVTILSTAFLNPFHAGPETFKSVLSRHFHDIAWIWMVFIGTQTRFSNGIGQVLTGGLFGVLFVSVLFLIVCAPLANFEFPWSGMLPSDMNLWKIHLIHTAFASVSGFGVVMLHYQYRNPLLSCLLLIPITTGVALLSLSH